MKVSVGILVILTVMCFMLCLATDCQAAATIMNVMASPNHARPGDTVLITVEYYGSMVPPPMVTVNYVTANCIGVNNVSGSNQRARYSFTIPSNQPNGAAAVRVTPFGGTAVLTTCALFCGNPSSSQIVYVRADGNDSNSGRSWDEAKATILSAVGAANANEEIWVAAGTYNQQLAVPLKEGIRLYGGFPSWGGDWSSRDIKNYKTIITGRDIQANATNISPAMLIDGFYFIGCTYDGDAINTYSGASPTIANNFFGGCAAGIKCANNAPVIRNNVLRNNNTGIALNNPTVIVNPNGMFFLQTLIQNNYVTGNSDKGISITGTYYPVRLINNTIVCNNYGLSIAQQGVILKNNIIAYNNNGVHATYTSTLNNNCVYGNLQYNYDMDSGSSDIHVDPKLIPDPRPDNPLSQILPADPHLISGSPCVAAGTTDESFLPYWDIDGDHHYSGNSTTITDIGADHYNSNSHSLSIVSIYVKPASQGGDDANSGLDWYSAKATILAGINAAKAWGGDIKVMQGTYAERNLPLNMCAKLYGGYSGNGEEREPKKYVTTIDPGTRNGYIINDTSFYTGAQIDGFTIRNGSGAGVCAAYSPAISNNIISGNNNGIDCANAIGHRPYIVNNEICANGQYGINANNTYNGPIVVHNKIFGNSSTGLYSYGVGLTTAVGNQIIRNYGPGIIHVNVNQQGSLAAENNTIAYNSAPGVVLASYPSSNPRNDTAFKNNIIAFNSYYGIAASSGSITLGTNNDIYGNPSSCSWTAGVPAGNISADPLFANASQNDFHLSWNSPCIDAGSNAVLAINTTDCDGQVRPLDGNGDGIAQFDIGIDECNYGHIFYVRPGGSGTKNATSWANAADNLQTAIDAAYNAGGGSVWVAAGTYKNPSGSGNVANIKSYVNVYGGFTVGDTSLSARNWKVNKTILDGKVGGCVVNIENATACAVDGFVIRNGYGSGGGINCSNASATIANNIVKANDACGSSGGGIYASTSTLTVVGNVLIDNKAGSGGGIYYSYSDGKIANNTIICNMVTSGAGGVYLYYSSPALSNNIVGFNAGGGIYKTEGAPTFSKNDVYGNSSYEYSWTTTYPVGTDIVPADPQISYLSLGDWHISNLSPCHDPSGTSLSVQLDKDIDLDNRVYGSSVDIGADEWNGSNPPPPPTTIFYVSPGGSGTKDATSWANAADNLQTAIDAANNTDGGGEVWVAAGTYTKPSGASAVANIKSFVRVYGGFRVGDTYKGSHSWVMNKTILNGESNGSVVTISNSMSCSIDGFIIKNGGGGDGSGINCYYSTATITNNIIRGNYGGSSGGGIYGNYSALTVAGNVLIDNRASNGGGINYNYSNGKIANNTIICNTATNYAGGVYLYYSSPALSNNIVGFNAGGGIYKTEGAPTFMKDDVYGNSSYEYSWTTTYPVEYDIVPADPLIPYLSSGDWHITSVSPCRDMGNTLAVPLEWDIDCGPRIYSSTVDIGADEWARNEPPSPTIFYVSPGGSGIKDATSWDNAADNLQTAIDAANDAGGGEVWVAAGTYTKPSGASVVADIKSFVRVYGGFRVGDTSLSVRNWDTQKTVLDGLSSGSVVTISNSINCAIDGFIIKNGGSGDGSGINCYNSTATIANNIIRGNYGSGSGGGIYGSSCILTVAGNVLIDNKASNGAGICYSSTSGAITNNTIICNTASSDAGGIYLSSSSPALTNNIVSFNAGGGIYASDGTPSFTKNDFYGNSNYQYSWTSAYPVGNDLSPVDPVIPRGNWGDWHIASTSPCRDTGATLAVSMDKDIDCGNRIYDSVIDIGADEWNGGDPPPPPPIDHLTRWQPVSVQYSCPLVADLIPGDNGANEVAVIAYQRYDGSSWVSDGKAYIWKADGTEWVSKTRNGKEILTNNPLFSDQNLVVDYGGNDTLSTADINNDLNLELVATGNAAAVRAFGYDSSVSTFKPIAGWPASTPYAFASVAAAIGDANLDGSKEVVAGDLCCFVSSFNPSGGSPLWCDVTGSSSVSIYNSSVALGDVNHFADTNRIPDALVGSHYSGAPLFGFCGDEWSGAGAYPSGLTWPKPSNNIIDCSPAIGLIDDDSDNDFVVGDNNGMLYIWCSSSQGDSWTGYQLGTAAIHSSPVIAELNGQRCVVVGCDNGNVYAVKSDGSPINGWPSDGIPPSWRSGNKIIASPVIADVMNEGIPQIVVACTDGTVYALWADGDNHVGGPIAKAWVCAETGSSEIKSTPAVCSLDGTVVNMIVGSTDGIYKADLYSLGSDTFVPNNARWPWPTFHRDNARTGCQTTDNVTIPWWTPASMVSASISGFVTLNGNPVQGAQIYIRTLPGLALPEVYGRPGASRYDPVISCGDATAIGDEFDEGQYCISQLPPNQTYEIIATDANGDHAATISITVSTGNTFLEIELTP